MVRNEVDLLCFKVLQAQQHDLSCVLKEGGSVLLLAFLHPVPVDAEGAAVDEFADTSKGVGISGQHLPSQRPGPAVTAVHPDTGQNADYQHLRGQDRTAEGLHFKINCNKKNTTQNQVWLTLNVFLGLKSRTSSLWYSLKKGCAKACSAVRRAAGSTTSSRDIWGAQQL